MPVFRYLLPVLIALTSAPALADDFPFDRELTLDAAALPGSDRLPTLTIGANGQAEAGLWCRTLRGQFSVAGDTVIFIPGQSDQPQCPADRARRDEALAADLAAVTNWTMRGETLTLLGPRRLVYRINTN